MRLSAPIRYGLGLGLALLGGCASRASHPSLVCGPPECKVSASLQLVAEVQPSAMSPLAFEEMAQLAINADSGDLTLTVERPVTLSGRVTVGDPAMPLAATVTATRPSRIVGRPDVYYQATVDPTNGQYTLAVSPNLPDEHYLVRVSPGKDASLPAQTTIVTATADQTLDFALVDALHLPELHGTVTDSQMIPVASMQLQAIDPTTGSSVSTTVTTDATGAYSLRLVSAPPAMVQLVATPPANVVLPTLTLDVDTNKLQAPTYTYTADLQMPGLQGPKTVKYKAVGNGSSGAQTPMANATLVFVADMTDPASATGVHAIHHATAITDATGSAAVALFVNPDGRHYDVTVTPDASSPFQPQLFPATVAESTMENGVSQSFELAHQWRLLGQVQTPDGAPLPMVTVTATLGTQMTATPSIVASYTTAVAPAPLPTTTGVDGTFALPLNTDHWDIGLVPPPSMMLPWLWLFDVTVDGQDKLLDHPIMTQRGTMLNTRVVTSDGAPVSSAEVLLYTLGTGNACAELDKTDCVTPARLRAEGSTDGYGTVTLILPQSPSY